jgi:hypothetical protein
VNSQAGSRSWLRFALHASALVAAGSLGFLLAAPTPTAAADGLLPTTVTVPTLPVSVPTVSPPTLTTPTLPITTTPAPTTTTTAVTVTTVTTTSSTVTVPGAGGGGVTPAAAGADAATGAATSSAADKAVVERLVAGALRLPGGPISIPVTSVVAPNGLRVVVTVAPRALRGAGRLTATIRVRDAHGYLVRGAAVTLRSIPGGLLAPLAQKRSAADGRTAFAVRTKTKALPKTGRLWLLVAATDPARPKAVSVTRTLALPIAARSR